MNNFVSHQLWRRLRALFVLLALGFVHADIAQAQSIDYQLGSGNKIQFTVRPAPADITKAQSFEYRLGPGDRIQVKVFGRSDLSGLYTIRNSGSLSLPIAGEIKASDLTLGQLEVEIGSAIRS